MVSVLVSLKYSYIIPCPEQGMVTNLYFFFEQTMNDAASFPWR